MRLHKIAILAAIHGDEIYGNELYEAFIATHPELAANISLLIGNQAAYEKQVRYIDTDMNRSYNGDPSSHETIEISRLSEELASINPDYIFDVHTTRRDSGIFFITDSIDGAKGQACSILDVDVIVMEDSVIRTSFIGNTPGSVSLEYSLNAITSETTNDFVNGVYQLIADNATTKTNKQKRFRVRSLITKEQYEAYESLKNHDQKPEGVALMVPRDMGEMDAEYYGFWCEPIE
jgi:Succinylglutamate desuccinylase / Aspartoacylase family